MKTIFLVVYFTVLAKGMSEFIHEYYVITTRCNVTQDDVILTSRGMIDCGALCLSHQNCSGFRLTASLEGGCHIYGDAGIANSVGCSNGDLDMIDIYIEQALATAENMTWISNKTVVGNNNTDVPVTSCQNGGKYDVIHEKCKCDGGYIGPTCEDLTGDCSLLQQTGFYPNHGIYYVHPPTAPAPFQVFCFMTPTFGLTQIQSHLTASHSFNRSWSDYKAGFSYDDQLNDSWLGNDYIHYLSTSRSLRLLLDIKNGSTNFQYHHYDFVMGGEEQNYSVSYSTVSSNPEHTVAPCWPHTPPLPFSTNDMDNDGDPDENCAALHGAGWWFESENCTKCNLNGNINPTQHIRDGTPDEAFVIPIDINFNPQYILMALYDLP